MFSQVELLEIKCGFEGDVTLLNRYEEIERIKQKKDEMLERC